MHTALSDVFAAVRSIHLNSLFIHCEKAVGLDCCLPDSDGVLYMYMCRMIFPESSNSSQGAGNVEEACFIAVMACLLCGDCLHTNGSRFIVGSRFRCWL